MLLCVAFEYVEGVKLLGVLGCLKCVRVSVDVALETLTCAMLRRSAEKEISQEEGNSRLASSSTSVAGCFEQLNLNMQAQSVCSLLQNVCGCLRFELLLLFL